MTDLAPDLILANADLVLPDQVIPRGWLAVEDGRITALGEGTPPAPRRTAAATP